MPPEPTNSEVVMPSSLPVEVERYLVAVCPTHGQRVQGPRTCGVGGCTLETDVKEVIAVSDLPKIEEAVEARVREELLDQVTAAVKGTWCDDENCVCCAERQRAALAALKPNGVEEEKPARCGRCGGTRKILEPFDCGSAIEHVERTCPDCVDGDEEEG